MRIGLLMDQSTSYGRAVFAGVRAVALPRREWELLSGEPTPEALQRLTAQGLDGVIAHVGTPALDAALRAWGGGPVVNVSHVLELDWPRAGVDDVALGRLAAEHLLALNYRHFAYIGHADRSYARLRQEGFAAALEAGKADPPALWSYTASDMAGMTRWLRDLPKPLGLLVVGDETAVRVIAEAQAVGIGVPDPLAVISATDDAEVCEMVRPTITAVHFAAAQVGRRAATVLAQLLAGKPAPAAESMLVPPTHVTQRESTSVNAVRDNEVSRALAWIREHAAEPIGVAQVAKALGVGRRNLERKFAAVVGVSVYRHIVVARIALAKELLVSTDLPLDEIAKRTGFAGSQHLCDVFRRKEGRTPGSLRQAAGKGKPGQKPSSRTKA